MVRLSSVPSLMGEMSIALMRVECIIRLPWTLVLLCLFEQVLVRLLLHQLFVALLVILTRALVVETCAHVTRSAVFPLPPDRAQRSTTVLAFACELMSPDIAVVGTCLVPQLAMEKPPCQVWWRAAGGQPTMHVHVLHN